MQISTEEIRRVIQTQRMTRAEIKLPRLVRTPTPSMAPAASTVELSSKAQEIQRVTKQVQSLPDVREDLVQSLKERIENGTYNVSGMDIADLIVRRAFADTVR